MIWNRKLKFHFLSVAWFAILMLAIAALRFKLLPSPYESNVNIVNSFSTSEHLLGTDELGRDLLSRILLGAESTLTIAIASSILSLIIAFVWSSLATWFGKSTDVVLMRVLDVFSSIPHVIFTTFIALIILEYQKTVTVYSLIFIIGITHWFKMARILRVQMMQIKSELFIDAAVAIGASPVQIYLHHMLPNLRNILIILCVFEIPTNMLSEGILSFMGVGIQSPESSWGLMLQEGWRSYLAAPHLILFPSLFLFLTIFSLSLSAPTENNNKNL